MIQFLFQYLVVALCGLVFSFRIYQTVLNRKIRESFMEQFRQSDATYVALVACLLSLLPVVNLVIVPVMIVGFMVWHYLIPAFGRLDEYLKSQANAKADSTDSTAE
jgi:uncharacterized protein involved in cysteine biosynthesis